MLSLLCLTSCLEDYLDKAPDSGLSEKEVFSSYENFKNFFYSVYSGTADRNVRAHSPMYWGMKIEQKMTMESLTDMCDMCRMQNAQPHKRGINGVGFGNRVGTFSQAPRLSASWKAIRVANLTIQNIDMVEGITDSERNDFLGQAYFIRAFCHFELFRMYGSLPYIDKALGADDEWDLPRPTAYEMLKRIADDFDTAANYLDLAGKMRRDPASGAGNLADPDQDKPNGVAAKAFRGRALLYAASPLNNPSGDLTLWEDAAIACWEAVDVARKNGYILLDKSEYTKNFYGVDYSNEQIWARKMGTFRYSAGDVEIYLARPFSGANNASGQAPTENFVGRFETIDGYPLYTDEEKEIAIAAGSYNPQNPYVNRDPRFDNTIIYNQKPLDGYGNASLYVNEDGSYPDNSLMKYDSRYPDRRTSTGYYECKLVGSLAQLSSVTQQKLTDTYIRMAEVYLNYAEAANEAYGPAGAAPEADLTALGAVNLVRERMEMPPVRDEFTTNTQTLRPRIKNERIVELCFESFHYYCDIRRWMDAPTIMSGKLYGIRATKLEAPTAEYPTGFKYERVELSSDRQVAWKNAMYYVPIPESELLKMKNYVPNEAW